MAYKAQELICCLNERPALLLLINSTLGTWWCRYVCVCVCGVLNLDYFFSVVHGAWCMVHFRALSLVKRFKSINKVHRDTSKNVANSEGIMWKLFKFLEMSYLD